MIQQNQIFSDGGFIFEDYSSVNYLKAYTLLDDSALYDASLKQFAQLNLYSSNQSIITYRRFIKIPDILAFVGGILKLINLLFYYVNLKFSQVNKTCTIIDHLFDISNDKNLNYSNYSLENRKIENFIMSTNGPQLFKNKETVIKECTNNEKETCIKLKFTMLDYIRIICNLKSKHRKDIMIYHEAKNDIRKYFDILTIIKNILDL